MFASQRLIFAGKRNLQRDPFSPVYTNESGRQSLKRAAWNSAKTGGDPPHAPFIYRDEKQRT